MENVVENVVGTVAASIPEVMAKPKKMFAGFTGKEIGVGFGIFGAGAGACELVHQLVIHRPIKKLCNKIDRFLKFEKETKINDGKENAGTGTETNVEKTN